MAAFKLITGLLFSETPRASDFSGTEGSISWEAAVQLATDHLVAPAIGARIEKYGLENSLPDAVTDYFALMLRLNNIRSGQIKNEMLELARHLNRDGIVPLLIKGGAHLMSGLYDQPGERILSDVDILVRPDRIEDCLASMREAGYHVLYDDHPFAHSVGSVTRPDLSISIDLHREVIPYDFRQILSTDEVISDAIGIECEGARIEIPSPTHQTFLNIAHAQLSDKQYAFAHISLRTLYDFHRLRDVYRDQIDWADVFARFQVANLGWPRDYHIALASLVGDCEISQSTPNKLPVKLLVGRALWFARHPSLHRLDNRILRCCMHANRLMRTLLQPELRGRFWKKILDPSWRHRHATYIWTGRRAP